MDTSRQDTLVKQDLHDKTFHIIGCGGVGSWIGWWLAKALPQATFHFWDGDVIEESNLHRTPYGLGTIGVVKSMALDRLVLSSVGQQLATFNHGHWTEDVAGLIEDGSIIICAVDSMRVRQEIHKAHPACEYWDVGAEGTGGNISDSPADFEIAGADAHQGYFTPIFIGPVAVVAANVVWRILRGKPPKNIRFEEDKT